MLCAMSTNDTAWPEDQPSRGIEEENEKIASTYHRDLISYVQFSFHVVSPMDLGFIYSVNFLPPDGLSVGFRLYQFYFSFFFPFR